MAPASRNLRTAVASISDSKPPEHRRRTGRVEVGRADRVLDTEHQPRQWQVVARRQPHVDRLSLHPNGLVVTIDERVESLVVVVDVREEAVR